MTTPLDKAKRRRAAKREVLKDTIDKANEILERDFNESLVSEIIGYRDSIIALSDDVKKYDDDIFDLLTEEEDLKTDGLEAQEYGLKSRTVLAKIDSYKRKSTASGSGSGTVNVTNNKPAEPVKSSGLKLPKLDATTFSGDATHWKSFIEFFNAAVHLNEQLSDVEKYTYLKSYLKGVAAEAIEGLPVTSENYQHARDVLEKRYGKPQLVISTHMSKLMKLKEVRSTNAKELRSLYDKVESNVRALTSLGVVRAQVGPMLIPIILEKLPDTIRLQVSRGLGNSEGWKIDDFLKQVEEEILARESFSFLKNDVERNERRGDNEKIRSSIASLNVGGRPAKCAFCRNIGHYSDQCTTITDMQARLQIIKDNRLCFKCLQGGHPIRRCRSKMSCHKCKSLSHHTAICESDHGRHRDDQQKGNIAEVTTPAAAEDANQLLSANRNSVMLQTVTVTVSDRKERKSVRCNLIFDGGSQQTYISQRLVRMLALSEIDVGELNINSFGEATGKQTQVKEYELCIQNGTGTFYLKACGIPTICAPLHQRIDLVKEKFNEFKAVLPVNECGEMNDGTIDILIGADYYWSLMTEDIVRLDERLVAIRSKFGYILSGPIEVKEKRMNNPHSSLCVHVMGVTTEPVTDVDEDTLLESKVNKLWDLDTIGISPEEDSASLYDKIRDDITFNSELGKYEVSLPFKDDVTTMDDDYESSLRNLHRLKHKMTHKMNIPGLFEQYDDIIQRQVKDGVVEIMKDDDVGRVGAVRYLPHRPVINEKKTTTKVRVVYNASWKRKGSRSLNDWLHKGECTTPLIFGSLLRFRLNEVALVGDIESAYLQILIKEKDRDFLRFLWFKDVEHDDYTIVKMRFARVLFGLTPSQFLLSSVLRKHAESYNDPKFLQNILEAFYVDDLGTSLVSTQDAMDSYWQFKVRLAAGGFNLRKIRTNDQGVRDFIAAHEVQFDDISGTKVLGIKWDEIGDVLIIDMTEFMLNSPTKNFTRRTMLALIASFYDPLGLIQLWVILMKILFQKATKMNLGWDDALPNDVEMAMHKIIEQIRKEKQYVLSRHFRKSTKDNQIVRTELIGFSDASPAAYGACVYVRLEKEDGTVQVTLIAAKSRVAPIKNKQTIPRLELLGTLILTRLIKAVLDSFTKDIRFDAIRCYTDSQICLAWIAATEKEYKIFVQNRLNEIRKSVTNEWSYCPSKCNPADLMTKIRTSTNEDDIDLWFNGPEFLHENRSLDEEETLADDEQFSTRF